MRSGWPLQLPFGRVWESRQIPMKLLVDTNILLPLEPTSPDDFEPNTDSALLLERMASEDGHTLCVHPATLVDLARDRDTARRDVRRKRFERYVKLSDPPDIAEVQSALSLHEPSENDAVDLHFLAAIRADAVDYLVTEDRGIHKKARRLGLAERVLLLGAAVGVLADLRGRPLAVPPHVESVKAHVLNTADPIFESFRADYPEFDDWITRAKRGQRDAWVIAGAQGYAAVAIVKEEDGTEIDRPGRTLKICSFKVSDDANGQKFGELLLKAIFEQADAKNVSQLYVTVYPKHEPLVALMKQFGFTPLPGGRKTGEDVLFKTFSPSGESMHPLDFHIAHGPRRVLSYTETDGYVVPIQPTYHNALFPEAQTQQLFLPLIAIPRPHGSAIRKAYLCRSPMRQLKAGDNLFFYRSQDVKGIACSGVVESTLVASDPTRIAAAVGVRTVYPMSEIEEMTHKGEVLAVLFRQATTAAKTISLAELVANSVIKAPPQSIVSIDPVGRAYLATRLGQRTGSGATNG